MHSLFEEENKKPLAERMRPTKLELVVGQEHLFEPGAALAQVIKFRHVRSLILWGPPGSGKTTIGHLLANYSNYKFISISAVGSGVSDLQKLFVEASKRFELGYGTILFVDEIHRFTRVQQDRFLSYIEKGIIVLIGATTENPSFSLTPALLSRTQVLIIKRLDQHALNKLLCRAEEKVGKKLLIGVQTRLKVCNLADGDGRYLLNMAEAIFDAQTDKMLNEKNLTHILQRRLPIYDKSQEFHFNLISAFHKSLRGSDVDAALYWLGRMLEGGEDPIYIIRRLVRFASEDVGLADPQALSCSIAAWDAYVKLGSPEGELAIGQCVIYLSMAPKSNSAYLAFNQARSLAKETGSLSPPKHILNATSKLTSRLGYGKNYEYDHNHDNSFSGQNYFPEEMKRPVLYVPRDAGFEREIARKAIYWNKLRRIKTDKKN